ncbi:MAG: ATP-binding cassette domain-containing protein [Clostridia bacterium]|nr:ATP-binding cassette domain-containing protein [Clostridia bacterium]
MIKIENLGKKYGDKWVVDHISFSVEEGEIVGFLGPNGAGKTTTMSMLTGFLSSTEGSAQIGGINILEDPIGAKKQIGYLPELPPLYLEMTVREYLNFIYDLKNCSLDRESHLREIAQTVRISDVYNRVIKNLSKGYRQRVGIAQALVGNPKVIIFDEPTVGLDPKQIIEIRNLIKELGKNHTVILSTHILPEVQAVCDRIIIINKGKIVADERTDEISKAFDGNKKITVKVCGNRSEAYSLIKGVEGVLSVEALGNHDADSTSFLVECSPGIDIRKSLSRTLSQRGLIIIGMEMIGANLEDVFLKAVDDAEPVRKKRRRNRQNADNKED